jgi:HEAT repeat protein
VDAKGGRVNIEIGLLDEDEDAFEAALVAAVQAGPSGERSLLNVLRSTRDEERAAGLVSALGEADGPDGVAVLRRIVAQSADPLEVRTTAVVALTKRQGVAASDVLLGCLVDSDRLMPGYALMGLACVGDDRAWHEVLELLRRTLNDREAYPPHDFDDRTLVVQSDIVAAVSYLARHAGESWDRQRPVVHLLRSRWDRLRGAEQRWLSANWPACDPSQPESLTALDPTWFADWIGEPLFEALFMQGADG